MITWFWSCKNLLKWKHYNEYDDFSYSHTYVRGDKRRSKHCWWNRSLSWNTQGHENKGKEELTVTACQRAKQRWVRFSFTVLLCLKTVSVFLHLKQEWDVRRWQHMVYHDSSHGRNICSHLIINYWSKLKLLTFKNHDHSITRVNTTP